MNAKTPNTTNEIKRKTNVGQSDVNLSMLTLPYSRIPLAQQISLLTPNRPSCGNNQVDIDRLPITIEVQGVKVKCTCTTASVLVNIVDAFN